LWAIAIFVKSFLGTSFPELSFPGGVVVELAPIGVAELLWLPVFGKPDCHKQYKRSRGLSLRLLIRTEGQYHKSSISAYCQKFNVLFKFSFLL